MGDLCASSAAPSIGAVAYPGLDSYANMADQQHFDQLAAEQHHSLPQYFEDDNAQIQKYSSNASGDASTLAEAGDLRRASPLEDKRSANGEGQLSDGSSTGTDKKKKASTNTKDGAPKITERRKQQNRAAQKSFRERKDRHLKELEEKVAAQDELNAYANTLIHRLQAENDALRGLLGQPRISANQRMVNAGWQVPSSLARLDAYAAPPSGSSRAGYDFASPHHRASTYPMPGNTSSMPYPQLSPVASTSKHHSYDETYAHANDRRQETLLPPPGSAMSLTGLLNYPSASQPNTSGGYGMRSPTPSNPVSSSAIAAPIQSPVNSEAPLRRQSNTNTILESYDISTAWFRLSQRPGFAECDQSFLANELHRLAQAQPYGRPSQISAEDVDYLASTISARGPQTTQ